MEISELVNIGVAGFVLLWFMFRLERILNRFDKTLQLLTRAVIRQLERDDAGSASDLSRALSRTNGEQS